MASGVLQSYYIDEFCDEGIMFEGAAGPPDYGRVNALDFRPATMRSLFDYGAHCAERGRLWTTVDQAIARADKAVARWQQTGPLAKDPQTPQCPLDDPTTVPGQPVQQTVQVHNR